MPSSLFLVYLACRPNNGWAQRCFEPLTHITHVVFYTLLLEYHSGNS